MKNFKFLYLLLAVVGVVTFTSCKEEWTPGPKDTNMGVYFPEVKTLNVSAEDTSVDIAVARLSTDEAATVSLRYEAMNAAGEVIDLFTAPSSVEFAAGEAETTLTLSFDGSQLVLGEAYKVNIKLDEEQASMYAVSEATFTVMIPETWLAMGTGIYFDEILCELFGEADSFRGLGTYVDFEQNEANPNRIRVKNAFSENTLGAMWGAVPTWLQSSVDGDSYLEFDITDPNNVLVGNPCEMSGKAAHMFKFNLIMPEEGYDLCCIIYDGTPIVLENGIIKFPVGSVVLGVFDLAGNFLGTFTQTGNANGYMQFYLPGTEFANYDMAATYDGMYVSADGATAKAIFNFALGADVASYKFAFVSGDVSADPSATAEAIVAGSEDLVIFESAADTKKWEVELTKGVWTLVAVPYTAEGEARLQDTYALNFYFNGTGEMPEVNIDVNFGSYLELTGEESTDYPSDYWACVGIEANGADIKSIKAFVTSLASVENSGMEYEAILAGYGEDYSAAIEDLKANGAAIIPFNLPLGTEAIALVAIETIYGQTHIFSKTCTLTDTTGIQFGEYKLSEGDYSTVVGLFGGYAPGEVYFVVDGLFEMVGSYDTATRTMTTPGYEETYAQGDLICNDVFFYYNQEKTQVYGYWAAADADYAEACDLTFAYGEDGVVNALSCYFAKNVFKAGDEAWEYEFSEYAFSPAATVEKYVAEAAKASALVCAKSADVKSYVVASESEVVIKATPVAPNFTMANLTLK